jgi:L-seryl-tRNA(Ser) seleniumtransferase
LFIELGADLVAYSGGKDIHGPTDTGILYGRKDLIEAARAQMRTLTPYGIGRSMKVGHADVATVVYALERYMHLDMEAYRATWERRARSFMEELGEQLGVECRLVYPDTTKGEYTAQCFPRVHVVLDEVVLGVTAVKVGEMLWEGNPRIKVGTGEKSLSVNPHCLADGEELIIAKRLKGLLFVPC